MNDFSSAQLVRVYCVRSLYAQLCIPAFRVCMCACVCSIVPRTIQTFHSIRKMKWSIFAVFSVFFCPVGAHIHCSAFYMWFAYTHAGNGLRALCGHVICSKGDAFTFNDSHILRIFISDSEFSLRCHLPFAVCQSMYFVTIHAMRHDATE